MWQQVERLFQCGMLSFDQKQHRLFILQPLATVLMARGADGWVNAIHHIYEYTYWQQSQQAWESYMQREEQAAVRKAIQSMENGKLTRDDIERIKRSRRQEITLSDMEPPKVEPFEFFIIPDSTEAKVEPLAVGYYDPDSGQMDVATWDDVKQLLKMKSEE